MSDNTNKVLKRLQEVTGTSLVRQRRFPTRVRFLWVWLLVLLFSAVLPFLPEWNGMVVRRVVLWLLRSHSDSVLLHGGSGQVRSCGHSDSGDKTRVFFCSPLSVPCLPLSDRLRPPSVHSHLLPPSHLPTQIDQPRIFCPQQEKKVEPLSPMS